MSRPLSVLGICGSLRKLSYNRGLLEAARVLAPDGMVITTFEALRDVPSYDGDLDHEPYPPAVAALKNAVAASDGILFATPEYNYGIPGLLKNAFDWASRPPKATPLAGKPAAILGASTGNFGTARAQLDLRKALLSTASYAMLRPELLLARCAEKFDAESRLTDEHSRELLRAFLAAFAEWIEKMRP
jgi:chromate reductase